MLLRMLEMLHVKEYVRDGTLWFVTKEYQGDKPKSMLDIGEGNSCDTKGNL